MTKNDIINKYIPRENDIILETKTGDKFIKFQDKWYDYPSFKEVFEETTISVLDSVKIKSKKMKPKVKPKKTDLVYKGPHVKIVCGSSKSDIAQTNISKSIKFLESLKTNYNGVKKDVTVICHLNNSTGLSELYNSYINESNKDNIIVFTHDDVILEDSNLISKLHRYHEKWDVVGVAGCVSPVIKSPAYWHLMAERPNLRGFCNHDIDGKNVLSNFGPTKEEVDLIDGVFMSVKVKSLLDSEVRFDEDFDFHFYDLAFCKRAKDAGLKIGVAPIFITHFSGGGGNDNWKKLEKVFLDKYS